MAYDYSVLSALVTSTDLINSVKAFGAVGDGVVDDSAAIQAALDHTTVGNPKLTFPAGTYKITVGLTCATPNLELVGTGGMAQDATVGNGATQILVGSGIVGLTYDTGSNAFRGPVFRNLYFKDNAAGAATGGVLVKRTSNFQFHNCVFAGFTGASSYGLRIDGTNGYSQYGKFIGCSFHKCKIGCDVFALSGGHRFMGCDFDGNSNSGTVAAATIGLRLNDAAGNHADVYLLGCVFQLYATCILSGANSDSTVVVACRFEGYTTGIDNSGDFMRVTNSSFSNALIGGGGSSITNQATADRCVFVGNHVSTTNNIADSGTNTVIIGWQEGIRASTNGITTKVKAGTPADVDFSTPPVDGCIVVDSTANKIWVRIGGVWKGVVVA